MTFGELKTELLAIAKMTATSTVGARVARFVTRAEGLIARKVRALEMIEAETIAEAARVDGGLYNLPSRCVDAIQITTSAGDRVTRRPLGDVFRFNTAGAVHSYAMLGGQTAGGLRVELRGHPATDAELGVLGFFRPSPMTDDSDTRLLLTNHESLYVHGALHWLYLDAHDSDLAAAHMQGFKDDAAEVNAVAKAALRAGAVGNLEYHYDTGSAM